jgi:hypothetical protein
MDSSINGFEEPISIIREIYDLYSIEILEYLYYNLL